MEGFIVKLSALHIKTNKYVSLSIFVARKTDKTPQQIVMEEFDFSGLKDITMIAEPIDKNKCFVIDSRFTKSLT